MEEQRYEKEDNYKDDIVLGIYSSYVKLRSFSW